MQKRIALVFSGENMDVSTISPEKSKLHGLVDELQKSNFEVKLVAYSDEFCQEIEKILEPMNIILVWYNPLEKNKPRTILNEMLSRLKKNKDLFISSTPKTIENLGTKEILYKTRRMEWGSDVTKYESFEELKEKLPQKLREGKPRIIKQNRGNGGQGIWRIEKLSSSSSVGLSSKVKVLHALRGSKEEEISLIEFMSNMKQFFNNGGIIIDQEYCTPIPRGMIRVYMTRKQVVGFGQQNVSALLTNSEETKDYQFSNRIYYSKEKEEYQDLRIKMEKEWAVEVENLLGLKEIDFPVLWDADFLYRTKDEKGKSQYVLCEVNVSSVYPFPESAIPDIIKALQAI